MAMRTATCKPVPGVGMSAPVAVGVLTPVALDGRTNGRLKITSCVSCIARRAVKGRGAIVRSCALSSKQRASSWTAKGCIQARSQLTMPFTHNATRTYIQSCPFLLALQRRMRVCPNIPHLWLLPPQSSLPDIFQLRSEKLPTSGHHIVEDYTAQHKYTKDRQKDNKKIE